MPRRKVSFRPSLETLRPPREDENSVMQHFCRHITRCRQCIVPESSGLLLCQRGYGYAKDVFQYLYLKHGHVYSEVARRHNQHEVQVEVPRDSLIYRLLCQRLPNSTHARPGMDASKFTAENSSQGVRVDAASRAHRMRQADDLWRSDFLTVYATIPSIVVPVRIRRVDISNVYGSKFVQHDYAREERSNSHV